MNIKVAVIGSNGAMGAAITSVFVRGGCQVHIYDRDLNASTELKREISSHLDHADIFISSSASQAALDAEIIIPAVGFLQQQELASEIRESARNKIVISITNPLNDSLNELVTKQQRSAAEELADLLPDSYVMKAFNTVFAGDFEQMEQDELVKVNFVAGDHKPSVSVLLSVLKKIGFNPFYVGGLAASRALEQMTLALLSFPNRFNYNWLSGCVVTDNP